MKKSRPTSGNSILRLVIVGISVLFQAGWILLLVLKLNRYSVYISFLTGIISLLVVLRLYSRQSGAALKLPWIMLILVLPVMGLSLYLMMEIFSDLGRTGARLEAAAKRTLVHPDSCGEVQARLDPAAANLSRYLSRYGSAPVYDGTDVRYYPEAVQAFAQLKEDLRNAEKYILMEYFIVEDGEAFSQISEILEERARAGVRVQLMYDDIGSAGHASLAFVRRLHKMGIRCRLFNPALPVLNLFMNHRDHRKLTVIDGRICHTGGYNLANCYFDFTRPYGKWKDTGIRMEGSAVRSVEASFLRMWSAAGKATETADLQEPAALAARGFVQPFADSPLGKERLAENVYLNLLSAAKEYVWFMTPYLIISDEMLSALTLAAKRGVDVRIIIPGVADKKPVYQVTLSHSAVLAGQGVRIFTYDPGFCHAKQCLCDGAVASIGTSNLDYRSLYHHFENNVLLYGGASVEQIREDFVSTFSQCTEITDSLRAGEKPLLRLWRLLLRLFAPLL